MRSKEFIKEAPGSPGRGPGREMTDAQRAAQAAQGEENWQSIKNWWNNAPQTGGTAVPTAQDPAQVRGQGAAAAPVADVPLPQNQRTLRDPNSLNQAPAADVPLPQNQRTLRDPNSLNQTAPVADVPLPQNQRTLRDPNSLNQTAPAPSFNVPGAAQAGQQGSNYTTGVAQDRPHRPDAGADETTRNDYPFSPPGPGPGPKPVVKPIPSPTPVPKPVNQIGGKFSKGTPLLGPDGRTPVPALANKTVGPEFKPYPQQAKTLPTGGGQKIGGGQVAQGPARPGVPGPVSTGRQPWEHTPPAPDPVQAATPVPAAINRGTNTKYKNLPAAGSVVVKSGDTLSKIAAANGTTVPAIMALNPSIRDQNTIAAGQTVKLRESSEVARIRHLAGLSRN